MSGNLERNSLTIGTTWSLPKTMGADMMSSPFGATYSPAAFRSASPMSSRMRLQASTPGVGKGKPSGRAFRDRDEFVGRDAEGCPC